MREHLQRAFSAPVYDLYSAHECNLIASECPTTGEYHINEKNIVLEVLQNGREVQEGESGASVITSLNSWSMPIIRYQLDDLVTKGQASCSCGNSERTIREVRGRMLDYFPLPDGRLLHSYEITMKIRGRFHHWIHQYQLIQHKLDDFELKVIPSGTFPAKEFEAFGKYLRSFLGANVRLVFVERLDLEKLGKFRVAKSHVRSFYDKV